MAERVKGEPRGWRWFLAEFIVVAAGVLAALAAQQVAESLNERRLSREARDAIYAEMNLNVTNVSRRLEHEACVNGWIDEIEGVLDEASRTGATPPLGPIHTPPFFSVYTQRWQATTAGGRTALLGGEEQRAIGRVYDTLNRVEAVQPEERHAWTKLGTLRYLKHPTPEMIYDQRIALSEARVADRIKVQAINQARFFAKTIGVKGDAKLFLPPNEALKCDPIRVARDPR